MKCLCTTRSLPVSPAISSNSLGSQFRNRAMCNNQELEISLVVDKKNNRVVLVESDKHFVDTLLSFLTLPVGNIVRELGKRSSLGCMDLLYESIEALDGDQHLQTGACKAMLLFPSSESDWACQHLKLGVDAIDRRRVYTCPTWSSCPSDKSQETSAQENRAKTCGWCSRVPGTLCACGNVIMANKLWTVKQGAESHDGVFVRGGTKFLILDNLCIMKSSMQSTAAVLKMLGIDNYSSLQEKVVKVGRPKILELLKRAITSATPMSDVFLNKKSISDVTTFQEEVEKPQGSPMATDEEKTSTDSKKIELKLLKNRANGGVVYAEVGEDFADLVFSFLTIPLGALIMALDGSSSISSLDNLYQSVQKLSDFGDCIKSKERKQRLVAPKIATYFGCDSQLLKIEEDKTDMHGQKVNISGGQHIFLSIANPKFLVPRGNIGGGYVKGKFLIADNMCVSPFSSFKCLDIFKRNKISSFSDLKAEKIALGETEALRLLKACLTSTGSLLDCICESQYYYTQNSFKLKLVPVKKWLSFVKKTET